MHVCTWNVNNRVGKVTFRPKAAHAAVALGADVIVLNEFYPAAHKDDFLAVLRTGGWPHQLMSADTGANANRVLITSRLPMEALELQLPDFDLQAAANIAGAYFPDSGIKLVGLRVPAYTGETAPLLPKAWDWIEQLAMSLVDEAAVVLGDLNTSMNVTGARERPQFKRILSSGWLRAQPTGGASFFGSAGQRSEIDHVLATRKCRLADAAYVTDVEGFNLAGGKGALSDHAALRCRVSLVQ